MNSHELKSLQVRITKAKADADAKTELLKMAQAASSRAGQLVKDLEKQLADELERQKEPVITEHALLRYIERVYNINLDDVRKSILTPATIKAIQTVGSGKFPIAAGGRAVVKGNAIISITD